MAALVLALSLAGALVMPDACSHRARLPRMCASSLSDTEAKLCKKLAFNKALDAAGEELVQTLVDGGSPPEEGSDWWSGKYILRSCNELAKALRAAGGPLLDGAPVTVLVEQDGSLEIETDMLIKGCATGLRIFGQVAPGEQLEVTLNECEFFEPSTGGRARPSRRRTTAADVSPAIVRVRNTHRRSAVRVCASAVQARSLASPRRSPTARPSCGRSCRAATRPSRRRCRRSSTTTRCSLRARRRASWCSCSRGTLRSSMWPSGAAGERMGGVFFFGS
jgi:hypothetical protein